MLTEQAIKVFGSRQAIADALEISVQAVHQWGDEVPPLRAYQLKELRPGEWDGKNRRKAA